MQTVVAHLPTQYSASFVAQRLQYITETRADAGRRAIGRYDFYAARLVRYSGAQLHANAAVTLEFDLQGRLLSNDAGIGTIDIDAIKTRAQLLRSHALAQLAARSH